jgi:D-glycero-alpha-D-manno-heptose-7-phosphate kinase
MIITQTPFRVSFFGGGTDYPEHFEKHGGAVLATAIDKSAYVTATPFYSRLFDYSIHLSYRRTETAKALDDVQHVPFRECLRHCGITRDIEIHYAADLPSFSGLGTSSSFVVGLLNTLMAFQGRRVSPIELAYQAIEIERDVLGDKVGCQDQTMAAVGGFNLVEFRQKRNIVVHRLPLKPARLRELEQHLLMIYTGIQRRASDVAAKQIQKVDENLARLKRMRAMVDEAHDILMGDRDFSRFGALLHEGWVIKSELDESISNGTINDLYREGRAAGALGGKLLGAGGGGFLLFVVPPEKRAAVRKRLGHLEEVPVGINAPGSYVLHA